MRLIEKIWRGDEPLSRAARIALIPFEVAYRAVIGTRGWMYDHSILRIHPSSIAVVSIGNLSVGGTGKTPFAAWLAGELARRGARPAVVLRGYGSDEPLVHARLNPEIPVIIEKHRAVGIAKATQLGATVAVLDDAFQHRSAGRLVDVALLAAEQWQEKTRLLPVGPWREPLSSVRRAAMVVITRKTAALSQVNLLSEAVRRAAPDVPQAIVRFILSELRRATPPGENEGLPMSTLENRPVTAIAGIGEPAPFFQQLKDAGAVVTPFGFPDHYRYSGGDISRILGTSRVRDALIVCTLKDAVKLAPIWPATAPSLWYVLQRLEIESGAEALADLISRLTPKTPTKN